jgi:predicted RNA binding protein with dsRBD fold (UPF0201 family)
MAEVRISARCFPTEDRSKVLDAIFGLFPDFVPEPRDDPIVGTAHSTDAFAEALKRQRIRSAARKIMRRSISGDSFRFKINKQVATIGKISFSEEEHPLGDITITISSENAEATIDEIAPRPGTEGGDEQ